LELNERQLFRALGDIDDSLLEAAEQLPRRRKPHRTGLWIAACLCLATLTLAVPYFALFTKGASSADPNAKRIDKSLPQSTEAASDSTPNPGDPIQQFSPESSAEVPQAQVNSIPTQSYGAYPEDFSFSLTWEGNTYDSATGQFTPADGETQTLPLTQEQRQRAWNLLSGLELTGSDHGTQAISLTANGQTTSMHFSPEMEGPAQTILEALIRLVLPEES